MRSAFFALLERWHARNVRRDRERHPERHGAISTKVGR